MSPKWLVEYPFSQHSIQVNKVNIFALLSIYVIVGFVGIDPTRIYCLGDVHHEKVDTNPYNNSWGYWIKCL